MDLNIIDHVFIGFAEGKEEAISRLQERKFKYNEKCGCYHDLCMDY